MAEDYIVYMYFWTCSQKTKLGLSNQKAPLSSSADEDTCNHCSNQNDQQDQRHNDSYTSCFTQEKSQKQKATIKSISPGVYAGGTGNY